MAKKAICEKCKEVLGYTSKDYIVCGNCGELNWVGEESKVPEEPSHREKLIRAKNKRKNG